MSCSDTKKTKKRKTNQSGNMGDVLGKECGDSENDDVNQEICTEAVREEADGAASGDEQSSLVVDGSESKEPTAKVEDTNCVDQKKAEVSVIPTKEEKLCGCDACKERRDLAAEQQEEMRRLQSYWLELRQYIRMVYRMAMEGTSSGTSDENEAKMKELVQKLCVRDPHQLFQRLESQIQEFVIEAKVRQLELLHREEQTAEVAQIFLRGLLEGFEKLCRAAKQLSPLLYQLETEHLRKFNLTWEVLNKHLYQTCVYTDPLVQTNLPLYIAKLRNIVPRESDVYTELVHRYLVFDDEMTLIGAMWRDAETLIHEYNQEQATLKAKQRMLREDWELFKAQRKLIQQKMWNKTASELREFDEQLMNLASLAGSPESPRDGSPEGSGGIETAVSIGAGFCLGCSSHRGCPCDECAMTHLLTCGGLITPPDSPGTPLQTPMPYGHKGDSREYRPDGEGSEQPPTSSGDTKANGENVGGNRSETEIVECAPAQQQSCECHVCTAPLISPDMPPPGSSASVNLNLHTGGFHLYPHIHGTGGGGDASSLYPHLYNIHPSLLSQLGSKHSRLGAHIQDQIQLTGIDLKAQHLVPSSVLSVADLLPAGLSLETVPLTSNSPSLPANVPASGSSTVGFPAQAPLRPKMAASPNGAVPVSSPNVAAVPLPAPPTPQPLASGKPDAGLSQQSKPKPAASQEQGTSIASTVRKVQLNSQSTASTQTSPNKASSLQKVSAIASAVSRQVTQGLAKRINSGVPQAATGGGHPTAASSHSSSTVSSVRHSTTQTANSGPGHSHISSSLPDVVKSAASSTTSNRPPVGAAGKLLGHSCHKNHKHPGNADGEVIDMEDSSSQDDTCSERSSSTTTSTQRDSRHCDCCYCEVFGHGVPSVAPVSRNYQEMRERLRLLLTKKKAKCKMNAGTTSGNQGSSSNASNQPSGNQPTNTASANAPAKPPVPPAAASAAGSLSSASSASSGATAPATKPQQSTTSAPPLSKQDSADSVSNVSKDPRDLEALLDFIEGNQSSKCTNMKKAAKKARQKQKKIEEKEKREHEEAERLRGLETLQNSAPEVTITVVSTPEDAGSSVAHTGPSQLPLNQAPGPASKATKGTKHSEPIQPSALPAGTAVANGPANTATATATATASATATAPQMVTIKRVMEPNGAEPTVTITLKGATPDKDKVLFTLVNGQVCQSQEETKPVPQASSESSKNNQLAGKKKKAKGNNGNSDNNVQPQNPPSSSKGKNVKSQPKAPVVGNGPATKAKSNNNCKQPAPPVAPPPSNRVSAASRVTGSVAAVHVNGVAGAAKPPTSVAALRTKVDTNTSSVSSFSLENLKLPPGITITKVDGPTAAAAAQRRAQLKAQDNPKPPPAPSPPSSTTIIAAPTAMGGTTRLSGYGQAVNGSNVIVVDTGRMKEELESTVNSKEPEDNQNSAVNGKKKKKKKNGNGYNENDITAATVTGLANKSQQKHSFHGVQVNGKPPNNQSGKSQPQVNGNLRTQSNIQYQVKQVGCGSKNTNPLMQPAIIKVNGSMVTIRNPALQQAMSAGGPRLTHHMNGHAQVQMNGDVRGKNGISKVNKKGPTNTPLLNGITNIKGKENSVSQHFANGENSSIHHRSHQAECNGVGTLRVGKMAPNGPRSEENGIALRGGNSSGNASSRMRPLQQQIPSLNQKVIQKHPQESPLQHTSSRAVIQAQTAMRDAMAAATEAKKNNKKKKKKGAGGQGHADDWTLVESVFAPKDIDLENGDIDDDERELEAFKRFCFNSVPPKRKEKVHLNIKDIVLKKKSSAIGCS